MISNGGCDPFHYLKGRGGLGYKPSPPYMHGLGYDYNLMDGCGIYGTGRVKGIIRFETKIENANNLEDLNKLNEKLDGVIEESTNSEYDTPEERKEDYDDLLKLQFKILEKKSELILPQTPQFPQQEIIEEAKVEIPEELLPEELIPKKKKKNKYVIVDKEPKDERKEKLSKMFEKFEKINQPTGAYFRRFKSEAEDIFPLKKDPEKELKKEEKDKEKKGFFENRTSVQEEIKNRIKQERVRREEENKKYKLKKYDENDLGDGKILEQVMKEQFDENNPPDLLRYTPEGAKKSTILLNDKHPLYRRLYTPFGDKQSDYLPFDASADSTDIEFKHYDTLKYRKTVSQVKRDGLSIQNAKLDNFKYRVIFTDDPKTGGKMLWNIWDKIDGNWVNKDRLDEFKNNNGKQVQVIAELASDPGKNNGGLYNLKFNQFRDEKYNPNVNQNLGKMAKKDVPLVKNRNLYWVDPSTLPQDPEKKNHFLLNGENLRKFKLKGYKKKN